MYLRVVWLAFVFGFFFFLVWEKTRILSIKKKKKGRERGGFFYDE